MSRTYLGMDDGMDQLDDISDIAIKEEMALARTWLDELRRDFDIDRLDDQSRLSYRLFEVDIAVRFGPFALLGLPLFPGLHGAARGKRASCREGSRRHIRTCTVPPGKAPRPTWKFAAYSESEGSNFCILPYGLGGTRSLVSSFSCWPGHAHHSSRVAQGLQGSVRTFRQSPSVSSPMNTTSYLSFPSFLEILVSRTWAVEPCHRTETVGGEGR